MVGVNINLLILIIFATDLIRKAVGSPLNISYKDNSGVITLFVKFTSYGVILAPY